MCAEFSEVWRSVSKLFQQADSLAGKPMPGTAAPPACQDLQSPKRCGYSRYPYLNNGDSPGDVEPSQDIFWDSTSPTPSSTGVRNTRVVEISDIVDRIAPKDVKRRSTDSALLQWIGDSAVPCTPDIPKPRARRKSSRQSSVDDLMKLARQFDKNMQEDRENSEQLTSAGADHSEGGDTPRTKLTKTSRLSNVSDTTCPSSLEQAEAELHALFDSSTQRISGRLSQSSSASACSLKAKEQPVASTSAKPPKSELQSADSGPAAHPAGEKESCGSSANNCDDFDDDDWENDDLLNDPFVLAMTQPEEYKTTLQSITKANTTHFNSACKPTANINSAHQPSTLHSKPSYSTLQEQCPKPKTTNRSTFQFESNPHFQRKAPAKSSFTVLQAKPELPEQKSASTGTTSRPRPDETNKDQKETGVSPQPDNVLADCLWDDGEDDELLYQVCDSVERISSSQPQQLSHTKSREAQDAAGDKERKATEPLPISAACSTSTGAKRQSPSTFVRSNSLPMNSSSAVSYQGWNGPMTGTNSKSRMSQSLPGNTFNRAGNSSGAAQAGTVPHTVTARGAKDPKSHHLTFKRNVSDSAVISNKVFVTSQMTGKCSSPEIQRKKQEALARRRLRMQNATKP